MKKIRFYIILFVLLIVYLIVGKLFDIYIPCPIHFITGLYCPGCGITRMLFSMIKLDFYQAFRYNPLMFISTPFILFLFINNIYSIYKNKKSLVKKIPNSIWYILLIITILFGILRNIITYLAPTVV
jgi:hypothetical protein